MAKIEADKELTLKEIELKAQAQTRTHAVVDPPPPIRNAKSPKLPAFIDQKDELDSDLLCFERYGENAMWEKTCGLLSQVHYLQEEPRMYIPGCQMEMLKTTTS